MKKISIISLTKGLLTPDRKAKLKLLTEKELQDYIIVRLKKANIYFKKIESVGVMTINRTLRPNSNKGMSDIILYIANKVVNIEVKPLKGSLSIEQIKFLQETEINCSNVLSVIVASCEGFDLLFNDLTSHTVITAKEAYKADYFGKNLNIYLK